MDCAKSQIFMEVLSGSKNDFVGKGFLSSKNDFMGKKYQVGVTVRGDCAILPKGTPLP
jgi:hypothetical protein